mmetsp:Transcript_7065/g.13322  ORF Transcript_7065/g.13322 Transcript_7065/m.13322 type:complete len:458 (+) Transcript_7065:337-1710(+)
MNDSQHRFPLWAQFSCVMLYFGFDLILRFCYQSVLDGNSLVQQILTSSSASATTRTDKVEESYNIEASYSKPAFLVLCCYATFSLWGPLVVFPYLYFYRRLSILEYYTNEWSAALSFQKAFLYTCCMGMILFMGNLGYVSGLRYISVALGSALSQGEAPLTVWLSVLVLGRYFGTWEKRGVALSLLGIALIALPPLLVWKSQEGGEKEGDDYYQDTDSSTSFTWGQQLGGVISTFLGAFGFGAYQVFWPFFDDQRYTPNAPAPPTKPIHAIVDTLATLTLVGLFLLSTGWILILFLHLTGIETFEIPPEGIRGTLILSSILSAVTDALNGIACVVASTVVVALAYPLIIPLSVLLQWWVDGISPSKWGALGWIGTVLVIAGVFCLEICAGDDGSGGDHDSCYDDAVAVEMTKHKEDEMINRSSNVHFLEMDTMIMNMSMKDENKSAAAPKMTITELV